MYRSANKINSLFKILFWFHFFFIADKKIINVRKLLKNDYETFIK